MSMTIIKLGGSLLTDKTVPYSFHEDILSRIGREIASYRQQTSDPVLLVHGSGSFGHPVAQQYETAKGFSDVQGAWGACLTHHAASQINQKVIAGLLQEDLPVVSVMPSAFLADSSGAWSVVDTILDQGLIPVLYGDVVWDKDRGCKIYSGETIIDLMVRDCQSLWNITRIIHVGKEDGVYDNTGQVILEVTPEIMQTLTNLDSHGTDVTGGMLHKLSSSLVNAQQGLEVFIINGRVPDTLYQCLIGGDFSGSRIKG